jgi:hypothetical protein
LAENTGVAEYEVFSGKNGGKDGTYDDDDDDNIIIVLLLLTMMKTMIWRLHI